MIERAYTSKARVQYYTDYCVAYIDPEIARYYRSFIPKAWTAQPPKYPPHITIVRKFKESVVDFSAWKKYDGVEVSFNYISTIFWDETYYWLECYSRDICRIRKELGLQQYRDGFGCYHVTIANCKEQT